MRSTGATSLHVSLGAHVLVSPPVGHISTVSRVSCIDSVGRLVRLGLSSYIVRLDHIDRLCMRWSKTLVMIHLSWLMVLLGSLSHMDMCSATLMVTGQYHSLRSLVATFLCMSHSSCTVVVVPLATSQLHEVRLAFCSCRLPSHVNVDGHASPFGHAERLHMYNTHE